MFRLWNGMTKIKVFAHTLSCSPQSKSEQIVEQITSTRMLFGDLEHITSTKMLFGDLEHITSTKMLFVTWTRIICGDLDQKVIGHLKQTISTRMLLVTSSTSPRPGGRWSPWTKHLDQDVIGHLDQNNMWWPLAHHLYQDVIGHLEHITSTRMLLVTSTRMLLVTSTRIIYGYLEHITSTRRLSGSTTQSKHFLRNIRDHILSGLKISNFLESSRGEDKNRYSFL